MLTRIDIGSLMKNTHFGHMQNKKPYDKPQKSAKGRAIGAKVFASYPQPLIGNVLVLNYIYFSLRLILIKVDV